MKIRLRDSAFSFLVLTKPPGLNEITKKKLAFYNWLNSIFSFKDQKTLTDTKSVKDRGVLI